VPHLRCSRAFLLVDPALTGWAKVWRASGALESGAAVPAIQASYAPTEDCGAGESVDAEASFGAEKAAALRGSG